MVAITFLGLPLSVTGSQVKLAVRSNRQLDQIDRGHTVKGWDGYGAGEGSALSGQLDNQADRSNRHSIIASQ